MERGDLPIVFKLLNQYLSRYDLVPIFQTHSEIEWWLLPKDNIVTTYVVEVSVTSFNQDAISQMS